MCVLPLQTLAVVSKGHVYVAFSRTGSELCDWPGRQKPRSRVLGSYVGVAAHMEQLIHSMSTSMAAVVACVIGRSLRPS